MDIRSTLPLAALLLALGWGYARSQTAAAVPVDDAHDCAQGLSDSFQRVIEEVGPAVVSVTSRGWGLLQGSGVIVSEDGIAITNAHVVGTARTVRVELPDGRVLRAQVLGRDEETDVAVLRLPEEDLPYAELDLEPHPAVGEWVLAMGSPRGLEHTVTAGIVSGVGRADLGITTYEDFIQTDAAINPGNSGGPLVDLGGRVVGINTAKGNSEGDDYGLGFAIPGYQVQAVLTEILQDGQVRRGYLGVEMVDLNAGLARRIGYEGASRVFVQEVREDTPAERAGIRQGDLILSIGDNAVTDSRQLLNTIAEIEPGTPTRVALWRDGERFSVEVTLAQR